MLGDLSALQDMGRFGRQFVADCLNPEEIARDTVSLYKKVIAACLPVAAMRGALCLLPLMLGACAAPGGPYPSLQPRAAEAIDPRIPVVRPINDRPVAAGVTARLSALVDQARSGNAAFDSAAFAAERLASAAGAPRSEGWIAAQEALTAAIAARKPTAQALGDIDEIAASALQTQRGIAPNDLAAIQNAASEVAAIDARQTERVDAIQKRLGI